MRGKNKVEQGVDTPCALNGLAAVERKRIFTRPDDRWLTISGIPEYLACIAHCYCCNLQGK